MSVKGLLIVTYYRYPDGDAGSVRQHMFAKMYKELGYDVTIVGMGECTDFKVKKYDGIPYVSFRNRKSDTLSKLNNYLGFKKHLKNFLKTQNGLDVIHIVDIPANALFYLKKYAKKNGIKLVHDSVEWYSPEQFKNGKRNINYILKNQYNTKWIDEQFSVISISSFLEKHFSSRGINTVRIPVMMDTESITFKKQVAEDKTVFLYAGSPGKKDYLKEIVTGFSMLSDEEIKKAELRVVGVKQDQLLTLCGVEESALQRMGDSLVCFGRIPREKVLEQLESADFTVLLRSETQRYAKAGFPTKVVESLVTGTPVVTNLTSDLGMYLEDGVNSLIVKDCTSASFSEAVKRALILSSEAKNKMQLSSRRASEEKFDYTKYTEVLTKLL